MKIVVNKKNMMFILRVASQFLILLFLTLAILRAFHITIGIGISGHFLRAEIWIFFALFYLMYFNFKSSKLRFWISYILAVTPYIFFNMFYANFERVFKISDFVQFYELVGVLTMLQTIGVIITLIIILIVVYVYTHFRTRSWLSLILLGVFFLPAFLSHNYPHTYVNLFNKIGKGENTWMDMRIVKDNGYFFSIYFFHSQQLIALEKLNDINEIEVQSIKIPEEFDKNIHIVLFESFVDGRDFENVEFNRSPIYSKWAELTDEYTTYYTSAVFGGGTANTEFEVLCASPSLRKINSVEFNTFTGQKMDCLPTLLSEFGYQSITSNGYKPTYFNKILAYESIGFDEQHYPSRYLSSKSETYLQSEDDPHDHLQDEKFFTMNLEYIKKKLDMNERVLNFMVPVYGHYPHPLAKEHPRVISNLNDVEMSNRTLKMINQNYYRTKSLYEYIQKLIELDPNSIILVYSDHLPKMEGIPSVKKYGYKHGIFEVPGWIWIDGKLIENDLKYHYELMPAIMDLVTKGEYCKINNCKLSEEEVDGYYYKIMKQAIVK